MSFWDNVKNLTKSYSDEEYEDEEFSDELYEEPPRTSTKDTPPANTKTDPNFNGKLLNMNSNKPSVVLFRPNSFNDASQAADDLRGKKAIIVNMENVDRDVARRVVDFLSGCAYALDGKVKKIAQATYLFCPNSMEVAGDLEAAQPEPEANF